MMRSATIGFTGKERDTETGLDYFGARYFSGAQGRFTSPDPLMVISQKLTDPQQWNMYGYGRGNPLRFVDPTGKRVELVGDDAERKRLLDALKSGVGTKAASYLTVKKDSGFLGLGKTHYYVGVTDAKAFAGTNAVANKLSGMIGDTNRDVQVQFVAPGTQVAGYRIGSIDKGMTPALTGAIQVAANVSITSGSIGTVPASLMSNNQPRQATLSEVLIHELGHVDATWYHGATPFLPRITNGDAVPIENQVREIEGVPLRLGHDKPFDVPLVGEPY